jgi:hypothetical protein
VTGTSSSGARVDMPGVTTEASVSAAEMQGLDLLLMPWTLRTRSRFEACVHRGCKKLLSDSFGAPARVSLVVK